MYCAYTRHSAAKLLDKNNKEERKAKRKQKRDNSASYQQTQSTEVLFTELEESSLAPQNYI
jgi:hypothetical protein